MLENLDHIQTPFLEICIGKGLKVRDSLLLMAKGDACCDTDTHCTVRLGAVSKSCSLGRCSSVWLHQNHLLYDSYSEQISCLE